MNGKRRRSDMFTGIVEEIGTIKTIQKYGHSSRLCISCHYVLENTKIGDSIAVNGACLTVTSIDNDCFCADVTSETMKRTAFSLFRSGTKVNLERALTLSARLGGHIVLGHVDGVGEIISRKKEENAVIISFQTNQKYKKYLIEKGSVAIDGVSLTIAEKKENIFTIALIPHTGKETILLNKNVGDVVNIEYDYIGKYIEQLMNKSTESSLTMEDLEKYNLGGHYGV